MWVFVSGRAKGVAYLAAGPPPADGQPGAKEYGSGML